VRRPARPFRVPVPEDQLVVGELKYLLCPHALVPPPAAP
jgi:hypothetical protein